MATAPELQPAVVISRNNVVLIYTKSSTLQKRIYSYEDAAWGSVTSLTAGAHPSLIDQFGILWLVWYNGTTLYYSTSLDGGLSFMSPVTLAQIGSLPAIALLPSGLAGIVFYENATKNIILVREVDNFIAKTTIATLTTTPTQVLFCNHHDRLIATWVVGETVSYRYSDDSGVTWSSTIVLGTYTGVSLISLPTEQLLVVVEYHLTLWGRVSRDNGISWDDAFEIPEPEAAINPALLFDSYNDTVIFSSELDISTPVDHTYKVRLRDLPFYAFIGEVLDTGWVYPQYSISSSSST